VVSAQTARTARSSGAAGIIGASVTRKEDPPLLRGDARFIDDLHRPGTLHAAVLRSSHAHARILSIDAAGALAHPGVADVVVHADLPASADAIPMRLFPRPGMERFLQPPLARDTVRYSGEPVAVVLAESRYVAEDALELVEVDYEPLDPILDVEEAARDGALAIHAETGTNVAASFGASSGDVERVFAEADLVVGDRVVCQRHAAVPLETRGLVAEVDPASGQLTVWGAAKVVHTNRRILARLLDWPEERVRLVELHVGGGFGARGEFYPEDLLIPFCAIRTRRPVSWTEDREENLRAMNHSREAVHHIELALRSDGTFLGLRDELFHNGGAYVRTHGSVVAGMSAGLLPGPYRWGAYHCDARHVLTNKTPAGTYRAPGRYEANLARERVIDMAARRLGRDPADLRRQNLVRAEDMPHANGSHTDDHPVVYDSGDYAGLLDRGLELFGYDAMRSWAAEETGPAHRRGVGLAYFVEKSGIGRWEYARVALDSRGKTIVHSGVASLGQGVETVLAQVCAEGLGVPYADVTVRHGDTATVADGVGSFGSRASALGGAAVLEAAQRLRARLLAVAADLLEASPDDLSIAGDRVAVSGSPSRGISLTDLFDGARAVNALGRGMEPGLEEEAYAFSEDMSFPYGLHCAAVEVDVETGHVHIERYAIAYDVGRALNPKLIDGQIVGGLAQGIGGALFEELAYAPSGQLATGSFMDYLLPTAAEVPPVKVLISEDAPSPLTSLGAKGAGEGGTAAAGAAIANAVSDALGADANELPLSPQRIVELAGGPA
jgi:CO/xanthine dehydrogenase Mo-binding subunit